MIKAFLYREKGKGKGYGFVQGREYAVRFGCERYMNFYCSEPGKSIRFRQVGNDTFMLLYVVAVPEGTHHESRGQIIASGYLFGEEEADELMSHPEYVLELKHCKGADDLMEENKIDGWSQVRMPKRKSERKQAGEEIFLPGELQKPYFCAVMTNQTNEINTQVFHSLREYSEGQAAWFLVRALKILPVKIRKYISWNTHVRKLTEVEDYEWNFLAKYVLDEIEASGFSGGRAAKRIILCDGDILHFQHQKTLDGAWMKYCRICNGNEYQVNKLWPANREDFTTCLLKKESKDKEIVDERNRIKRPQCYKGIGKKDMRTRLFVMVRIVILAILIIWTLGAVRIAETGERFYTISIQLDVFCAAGIFGIACLLSSLLSDLKWKRRMRQIYQKSSGR